eukprot:9476518-Pyramimonas_sp.AAC.1
MEQRGETSNFEDQGYMRFLIVTKLLVFGEFKGPPSEEAERRYAGRAEGKMMERRREGGATQTETRGGEGVQPDSCRTTLREEWRLGKWAPLSLCDSSRTSYTRTYKQL